jgi:aminoglycoside phosphotransferase (APT) family kinase protein
MWAVRKEAFAGAKQDGGRLLKQIEKQIFFSAKCRTGSLRNISVPEVYGIKLKEENSATSLSVDMEYIPFTDARSIMLERDRATNEWMIESVIDLMDYNFSISKTSNIQSVLPEFQEKARSIKSALSKSELVTEEERREVHRMIEKMLEYYQSISLEIPVGFCHGDLTLANMLIDPENREVCVFDFLDCFIVSLSAIQTWA